MLATGGGCVTRPENRDPLRQNGTVVWLKRPLRDLPIAGRPVSQALGVEEIYRRRQPLYEQFSDFAVDNTTPEAAAEEIFQQLSVRP